MFQKNFKTDERGDRMPINIVVMLVVGMVALAALLSIIPKSKENLSVDIIDIQIDTGRYRTEALPRSAAGDYKVKVQCHGIDKNNNPVEKSKRYNNRRWRIWGRPDKQ